MPITLDLPPAIILKARAFAEFARRYGVEELLDRLEENEKAGLEHSIQKTKTMASGSITSWQIERGKCGSSDRFYFHGLQNHCRWSLQP